MIRKLLICSAIISFILTSCSNGPNVPNLVNKKFEELYPKATDIQWIVKENMNYQATFKVDSKSMISSFSKYGIWLDTKYKITDQEIPGISAAYIKKFYPKSIITQGYSLKNPDGDFFEIDVKNEKDTFPVIFDKEGKLTVDDHNVLLKNFKKMYPNPADVIWERATDGNFDVMFKDNGKASKVSFRIDGTWIETQTMAAESEVPATAFSYIKKNYRNFDLKGIIFVKTNDTELFDIVIITKDNEVNLYFDLEGNFIKKDEIKK